MASTSSGTEANSKDGAKITELEDELAKLRAQIAMIVSGGCMFDILYFYIYYLS